MDRVASDVTALWTERATPREIDVVGLGQASIDHVGRVEGLPPLGGKRALLGYRRLAGGQIATALLALTRLGLRTALIGSVGDDEASLAILAPLRRAGVDVEGVRVRVGAPSQLALILVDRESGERTVLWYRDPSLRLSSAELRRAEIVRARALLLDAGDPEASTWAAKVAREAGMPVVLDADAPGPGIDALLDVVDFPIVSRTFAVTHFGGVRQALAGLCARGARLAVVTLGAQGALARGAEGEIRSPAFAVTPRDTTGAGDVFHAAFVLALLEGCDAERALRMANAAAAIACGSEGAQGGLATREELEARLAHGELRPWREPAAGEEG
jgi:sugar/nucleoside kinase (ribokinase family)